ALRDGISYSGRMLVVLGTPGGDVLDLTFRPGTVRPFPTGPGYIVTGAAHTINLDGVGIGWAGDTLIAVGNALDRLILNDNSAGIATGPQSTFVGPPVHSRRSNGGGFVSTFALYGFGSVRVNSAYEVILLGSASDDTLITTPTTSTLSGPGFSITTFPV